MFLLLVASSAGCILPRVRTTKGQEAALIYGFFDVSASGSPLGPVRLHQDERVGIAYRAADMTTYGDGLFFVENVPPMRYAVAFFFLDGIRHHVSDRFVFAVKPGAMHFLGVHRYEPVPRGWAQALLTSNEEFHLTPSPEPTERDVLQLLHARVQDPRWKRRIARRLRQLKPRY